MENRTEEERRLILPMMKNYIEKYTPAGDFEKAKARVLVRGDLQKMIGETQGPVSRTESIFIIISIATYHDLEVLKIDITAAYLNTPMNEDVFLTSRWMSRTMSVKLTAIRNRWNSAFLVIPQPRFMARMKPAAEDPCRSSPHLTIDLFINSHGEIDLVFT